MSKGPIALMTAVAITSTAAAGYFGYKNASIESRIDTLIAERVSEKDADIEALNEVIAELTDQMASMTYVKQMDDETYESQIAAADLKLVEMSQEIDELTEQLAASNIALAKANKSARTYRSRYLSEKDSLKSAKLAMNEQLAKEKFALAQQNQKALEAQRTELEGEYSTKAQRAETEKRVDEIMTNFSNLRVDLDLVNKCDPEYLERYGEAKSMLNHMRTYIQQNELSSEYYFFVISNDAQLTRKTREICIEG